MSWRRQHEPFDHALAASVFVLGLVLSAAAGAAIDHFEHRAGDEVALRARLRRPG